MIARKIVADTSKKFNVIALCLYRLLGISPQVYDNVKGRPLNEKRETITKPDHGSRNKRT